MTSFFLVVGEPKEKKKSLGLNQPMFCLKATIPIPKSTINGLHPGRDGSHRGTLQRPTPNGTRPWQTRRRRAFLHIPGAVESTDARQKNLIDRLNAGAALVTVLYNTHISF
jgi:hypothetical protein